jgi:carboxylesterase
VTESAYERLPLRAAHSLTRLWSLTRSGIDRVSCPVLLVRSADDHVAEPSNVTWLLANLRSPEVTEVMLEDSYHVATLDNDAETVFRASLAFARRVSER